MKLKSIFIISAVVVLLGIVGVTLFEFTSNLALRRVVGSRNTSLMQYELNRQIAISVMSVLVIRDQKSYAYARNKLYDSLSDELRNSIFPTSEYKGVILRRPALVINSVRGDLSNSTHIFKIDVTLSMSGSDSGGHEATFLIGVVFGKVVSIERI